MDNTVCILRPLASLFSLLSASSSPSQLVCSICPSPFATKFDLSFELCSPVFRSFTSFHPGLSKTFSIPKRLRFHCLRRLVGSSRIQMPLVAYEPSLSPPSDEIPGLESTSSTTDGDESLESPTDLPVPRSNDGDAVSEHTIASAAFSSPFSNRPGV